MARQPAAPLKRQTVTGSVASVIRERIISGGYQGGDQIRQEALAAELGVSRIPVREALLQLEGEGLVIIHAHRGAMVASLSEEDATEVFEARAVFEPFVLAAAMVQATEADVRKIAAALTSYEKAVRGKAPPDELSRLNWAFHISLCEPASRPRSMAILTSLHNSADRYLRLQIGVSGARERALKDHRALYESYASGDIKKASALLKSHISSAGEEVVARLRSEKKKRIEAAA
jgi:DNA-binding GntR family transcriptional regulator